MSDSRGDLKFVRESSIMYDLAEKSLVEFLDDVYNLDGHTIMEKDIPNCLPINAIKCLFKINKAYIERGLPFNCLFHKHS